MPNTVALILDEPEWIADMLLRPSIYGLTHEEARAQIDRMTGSVLYGVFGPTPLPPGCPRFLAEEPPDRIAIDPYTL